MRHPKQTGSASVEYVVITLLVIVVLFLPAGEGGQSVVDLLLGALRGFQANTTYLLSMP